MKAVIIDDEKDSREILAGYIAKYNPEISIAGFADSVATGIEAIRAHLPDIVFLDIEMPYGNGFDLLDQTQDFDFETVFVTAFDSYAIQALNQSAAYYLLKPISIEALQDAVEKIKSERRDGDSRRHTRLLMNNRQAGALQKIMLPTMEGFEIIAINTIMYCQAVDNFTRFILQDGTPLLICRTLKYYEDVLKEHQFLRVHRSHLINPQFVVRYSRGKGGYVTMKDNAELEVSPGKKDEFMKLFARGVR